MLPEAEPERDDKPWPAHGMSTEMYPCQTTVPEDGKFSGFSKIKNASCTFCSKMCDPPTIDSSIGLLDGFDGLEVFWTYGVMIILTILWQIYVCFYKKKLVEAEWQELRKSKFLDDDSQD